MTTQAFDVLLSRLKRVTRVPPATHKGIVRAARACCPAHDDRNPSLSVSLMRDGRVLVHCYSDSDCAAADVFAAVSLTMQDAAPDRPAGPEGLPPVDRSGPAAWASVAAAVEAAKEAVIEAVFERTDAAMWRALEALDDVRDAARAAMRRDYEIAKQQRRAAEQQRVSEREEEEEMA